MEIKRISTDILIIGGGTAGCYAAITIAKESDNKVTILEKANIKRSGCLAAGVNALNAYIVKGQKPQDYVNYAKRDADNIVREDLLLTMSERLNLVTKELENLGLVILKDEKGEYVTRGNRNIKINGENIKPMLSQAVSKYNNISVLNNVNVIDYIVENNEIKGVFGISTNDNEVFYVVQAKSVICTTGGAAGLYKPNNTGFSQHKMWYSPFNTGAGFAMGLKAGAEMTTFEMRFIALRCKDTIAPTGTIAQGINAPQINANGCEYGSLYGNTTSERVYGTVMENLKGRGPCYLKTKGIDKESERELLKAYLNMSPSQTLKWIETGHTPSEYNVEIEGTEPYIVGGHTASGYWVDINRATTIKGLYAAGDVAGGCPQKYVTGSLVEGEIAAQAAIRYIANKELLTIDEKYIEEKFNEVISYFNSEDNGVYTVGELEESMQSIMDKYAGGISSNYQFTEYQLNIAEERINNIMRLSINLHAENMDELIEIYELKERLIVCKAVIAHLKARKETRWHSFAENLDYPDKDDKYLKYINSIYKDGNIKIIFRNLITGGEVYEHSY